MASWPQQVAGPAGPAGPADPADQAIVCRHFNKQHLVLLVNVSHELNFIVEFIVFVFKRQDLLLSPFIFLKQINTASNFEGVHLTLRRL